ncbi:MAG TPA: chemotaxis protein CheW [Polyangiaceae bacterium]|nr:chemotaxis protein CheW [Polyangiaceae bacterium]
MSGGPPHVQRADSVAELMQASSKPRCMEIELSGALFGLDVEDVKEVIALRPISRVFHAPPVIAGVVNLRGEVLTVIDLAVLFGKNSASLASSARIVVLRDAGEPRRLAGVLVDRLGALREMPAEGLASIPTTLSPAVARLLAGVIPSTPPCGVIDVAALFQAPELSILADGAPS